MDPHPGDVILLCKHFMSSTKLCQQPVEFVPAIFVELLTPGPETVLNRSLGKDMSRATWPRGCVDLAATGVGQQLGLNATLVCVCQ